MYKSKHTIAIHQPNFLPWLGYFYKMAKCDTFIFYDSIQFSKGSYTKRVMIDASTHLKDYDFITLSVKKHALKSKINELMLDPSEAWSTKLMNKIKQNYAHAPYYSQVEEIMHIFKDMLVQATSLSLLNMELITFISTKLDITCKLLRSSDMHERGRSTEALIHLLEQVNATHYLSGHGAKKYVDFSLFESSNIEFKFSDFNEKFKSSSFESGLFGKSIICYLAHYSYEDIASFLQK